MGGETAASSGRNVPIIQTPGEGRRIFNGVMQRQGRNLQAVETLGDGNCQFRAVARLILLRNPEHHHTLAEREMRLAARLRAQAVLYMGQNQGLFEEFLERNIYPDFNTYLEYMSQDATWGDNLTLRALAALNGPIQLYLASGQLYAEGSFPSQRSEHSTMRLLFHPETHYDAIIPLEGFRAEAEVSAIARPRVAAVTVEQREINVAMQRAIMESQKDLFKRYMLKTEIMGYGYRKLQKRLRSLGAKANGNKADLQRRLLALISDARTAAVPFTFGTAAPSSRNRGPRRVGRCLEVSRRMLPERARKKQIKKKKNKAKGRKAAPNKKLSKRMSNRRKKKLYETLLGNTLIADDLLLDSNLLLHDDLLLSAQKLQRVTQMLTKLCPHLNTCDRVEIDDLFGTKLSLKRPPLDEAEELMKSFVKLRF